MSNQKVQLPAYANNPVYKFIDETVTSLIVTIFDAINPRGHCIDRRTSQTNYAKATRRRSIQGFRPRFLRLL